MWVWPSFPVITTTIDVWVSHRFPSVISWPPSGKENTMRLHDSASTHWVIIYLSYWSSQCSVRVCMFVSDKELCSVKSFFSSGFLFLSYGEHSIPLGLYGYVWVRGWRSQKKKRVSALFFTNSKSSVQWK